MPYRNANDPVRTNFHSGRENAPQSIPLSVLISANAIFPLAAGTLFRPLSPVCKITFCDLRDSTSSGVIWLVPRFRDALRRDVLLAFSRDLQVRFPFLNGTYWFDRADRIGGSKRLFCVWRSIHHRGHASEREKLAAKENDPPPLVKYWA